jgi:hypothetical protein
MPAATVGLLRLARWWGDSAKDVLLSRHHFEMLRIDAGAVAAEMVELHALGDWADKDLPESSVGDTTPPSVANDPIATDAKSPRPRPAAIGVDLELVGNPVEQVALRRPGNYSADRLFADPVLLR